MSQQLKPSTFSHHGKLWGASAKDWATIQEHTCIPVYNAVLAHLNIDQTTVHLDVGCGSGVAAHLSSQRGAKVTGIDASAALIELAQKRVPEATFSVGDMEQLPYKSDGFSFVTGFNSFQYAGNPEVALHEVRRVALPNAKVVIMTWGQPEDMEAAHLISALKPLLPAPPPGTPGPFALSDEHLLKDFARRSKLKPIEVFDVNSPWVYPDLETALRGLSSSGVAAKAIAHSSIEQVNQAHKTALSAFRNSNGSYVIDATFRCLIAEL
ncbi:class I SAM-dependent methyltransferase [Vibrio breoganii]